MFKISPKKYPKKNIGKILHWINMISHILKMFIPGYQAVCMQLAKDSGMQQVYT